MPAYLYCSCRIMVLLLSRKDAISKACLRTTKSSAWLWLIEDYHRRLNSLWNHHFSYTHALTLSNPKNECFYKSKQNPSFLLKDFLTYCWRFPWLLVSTPMGLEFGYHLCLCTYRVGNQNWHFRKFLTSLVQFLVFYHK